MSVCNVDVIKRVAKYLNTMIGTTCYNTEKILTTVLDKEDIEGFGSIVLRLAAKSGIEMSQEQQLLCYQWLEHMAIYADQAASNPTFAKSFLQACSHRRRPVQWGQTGFTAKNMPLVHRIIDKRELAAEDPRRYQIHRRMNEIQFTYLLNTISSRISKNDTMFRPALATKLKLQVMLKNLATGTALEHWKRCIVYPSVVFPNFCPMSTPQFINHKEYITGINRALERNTYLTGHVLTIADVAAYHVLYTLIDRLSVTERESLMHLCRWSRHIQALPQVSAGRPPIPMNTLSLSVLAPAVH